MHWTPSSLAWVRISRFLVRVPPSQVTEHEVHSVHWLYSQFAEKRDIEKWLSSRITWWRSAIFCVQVLASWLKIGWCSWIECAGRCSEWWSVHNDSKCSSLTCQQKQCRHCNPGYDIWKGRIRGKNPSWLRLVKHFAQRWSGRHFLASAGIRSNRLLVWLGLGRLWCTKWRVDRRRTGFDSDQPKHLSLFTKKTSIFLEPCRTSSNRQFHLQSARESLCR